MDIVIKSKFAGLILALSIIVFGLESSYSILLFLVVMLSIGIPHGSVDHIIAFINPEARKFSNRLTFYIIYISLILLNILIWIISPFIGLFGTVWGIMNSFRGLATVNQASLSVVAPGISEALIATAIGLFAAIPAVIAYNRYSAQVEIIMNRFEAFTEEFSSILSRASQKV